MMGADRQEIISKLDSILDKKNVKPPKSFGPKGHYIESWHAISEANRIFGFLDWSAVNVRLDCVSEKPRVIGKDKKDGWGVTYICTREITAHGATRQGTGAGHGYDVDVGLAHESAIKEAESDAEKRALRTFGNPFGLALYDKEKTNVGTPEIKRDPRQIADSLITPIKKATSLGDLNALLKGPNFNARKTWLDTEHKEISAEVEAIAATKRQDLEAQASPGETEIPYEEAE